MPVAAAQVLTAYLVRLLHASSFSPCPCLSHLFAFCPCPCLQPLVAEDKSELQSEVLEEYKATKDVRAWGLQVRLLCGAVWDAGCLCAGVWEVGGRGGPGQLRLRPAGGFAELCGGTVELAQHSKILRPQSWVSERGV